MVVTTLTSNIAKKLEFLFRARNNLFPANFDTLYVSGVLFSHVVGRSPMTLHALPLNLLPFFTVSMAFGSQRFSSLTQSLEPSRRSTRFFPYTLMHYK